MHNDQRLLHAVSRRNIAHAVFVTGSDAVECISLCKRAAAMYLTDRDDVDALPTHPDYHQLGPSNVGIDQVRALQAQLIKRPMYGMYRAVTFFEAHNMSEQAQNALLKTLEEPPACTLMLLTGIEAGLLPTIVSRCTCVRLGTRDASAVEADLMQNGVAREDARLLSNLSGGSTERALDMANPTYFALRKQAIQALVDLITGQEPPYLHVAQLISDTYQADDSLSKTEQKRKAAMQCADVWLLILRDALCLKLCVGQVVNADVREQLRALAQRFTTRQLQDMIELMLTRDVRLHLANPALALDGLMASIEQVASAG